MASHIITKLRETVLIQGNPMERLAPYMLESSLIAYWPRRIVITVKLMWPKIVREMPKVVAKCHLHGSVHQDLKPENFLFKSPDQDSSLKATDFGLSEFIKPGIKCEDVVGSAY